MRRWIVGVCLLWLGVALGAMPQFQQDTVASGVRLRLPKGITSNPQKALEVYRYTRTIGAATSEIECYDPVVMWRRSQHLAEWKDAQGNVYLLAQILSRKGGYEREHITKDEYDRAQSNTSPVDDAIQDWLNDFTGDSFGEGTPVKTTAAVKQCMLLTAEQSAALVFKFGGAGAEEEPFAFIVTPANDKDLKELPKVLQRMAMALQWRGAKKSGFGRGKESKFRQDAARKRAHASIANSPEWFAIDTPDYVLLTDLRKNRQGIVERIAAEMQVMRGFFKTFFAYEYDNTVESPSAKGQRADATEEETSPDEVAVIRVFAKEADYLAYAGGSLEWSNGFFSTTKRELVVKTDEDAKAKQQGESIRTITYHEGFHQFLFLLTNGKPAPMWFNEGHATFFESSDVNTRANKAAIRVNASRAQRLKQMYPSFPVKEIMCMSDEAFYGGSQADILSHYAMAWGLVSFLREAERAPKGDKAPFAMFLKDCFAEVRLGAAPDAIYAKLFKKYDEAAFKRAFTKYIEQLKIKN